MSNEYGKPLPKIDERSRPWWDAAREHRLLLQRCAACGHVAFPPAPLCPRCRGTELGWMEAAGRGRVWSWTVFHKSYFAGYAEDIPYAVAIVELEEGPRLWTHVVGDDQLRVGLPVEVIYDDVTEDVTLVKFRPAL